MFCSLYVPLNVVTVHLFLSVCFRNFNLLILNVHYFNIILFSNIIVNICISFRNTLFVFCILSS